MIKCIAIDDEPIALKQIMAYIEKTPFLQLLSGFENAIEALQYINSNKVDLMFVDIQMPDINGIDLIKLLNERPEIIFTTASKEYAVDGFRVNALDYVLKPMSYADFLESANKAKEHFSLLNNQADKINGNSQYIFIKSEYKIVRIEIDKIQYIESMKEYVRFHLENEKPIMSLLSMKSVEQRLPVQSFMRVHRSFIINLQKVSIVERNRIVFGETFIPIGDQYKDAFQEYVDRNFL